MTFTICACDENALPSLSWQPKISRLSCVCGISFIEVNRSNSYNVLNSLVPNSGHLINPCFSSSRPSYTVLSLLLHWLNKMFMITKNLLDEVERQLKQWNETPRISTWFLKFVLVVAWLTLKYPQPKHNAQRSEPGKNQVSVYEMSLMCLSVYSGFSNDKHFRNILLLNTHSPGPSFRGFI